MIPSGCPILQLLWGHSGFSHLAGKGAPAVKNSWVTSTSATRALVLLKCMKKVSKARLDGAWSNLGSGGCPSTWQWGGMRWALRSFQNPNQSNTKQLLIFHLCKHLLGPIVLICYEATNKELTAEEEKLNPSKSNFKVQVSSQARLYFFLG